MLSFEGLNVEKLLIGREKKTAPNGFEADSERFGSGYYPSLLELWNQYTIDDVNNAIGRIDISLLNRCIFIDRDAAIAG